MTPKALHIAIIGPCGYTGSHLVVELLNRGHTVTGVSRNPEKIGRHERYIPRAVDIDAASPEELAKCFEGADVVVSCFAPSMGPGEGVYMPFMETTRKLVLAYKSSAAKYLLFVGGAGSMHVPGTSTSCIDHPDFLHAYRRATCMSRAHMSYMEERMGIPGDVLNGYRDARIKQREGTAGDAERELIKGFEGNTAGNKGVLEFIRAARTSYMFFDGNESFRWSFVSPSALYRPGKRTGEYQVSVDEMVLIGEQGENENVFEGRLTGISAADLAVAIADEVEGEKLVHRHWSAWGSLENDEPVEWRLKLATVDGGSV